MGRHPVVMADLSDHPSVQAWVKLTSNRTVPNAITALASEKTPTKSLVYRLHSVGDDGSDVVAKRCQRQRAQLECAFYQDVLPRLAMQMLRFHGIVDEDDEFSWLFMEDAGDQKYANTRTHCTLGAQWLARLHTSAMVITDVDLPDRGPNHHLEHLRTGRERVAANVNSSWLSANDREVLERIILLLDAIESRWDQLETECASMPRTLVHGDFKRKNVRIRTDLPNEHLIVLDWEKGGYGPPAIDLHTLVFDVPESNKRLPLSVYVSAVRPFWNDLDEHDVRVMAYVGAAFRQLAGINWASRGVSRGSVREMCKMPVYEARLTEALRLLNWEQLVPC